ncbi:MAG: aminotransferase class I/II-fold pyridoxal phosphate-dependent enzyme [bacterium]
MKNTRIYLSPPHIGTNEKKYVNEAFDTNWIAPLGPNVNGFEEDIQRFSGVKYSVALSSGTAAIHLGLILLGVTPGDVVLCQSLTFSASANPVLYLGAIPVFIDSEPETWNICPEKLEKAIISCLEGEITRVPKPCKPKAILPVHLYGMPAKMNEINRIAEKYDIPVLEDAAEALGSRYNDKPCGSLGEMGVFSFNGNKIITTSGGGALLSDNADYINRARFLATQARDTASHYQHSEIGYNYRMSNVLAGIGRGQMEVLNDRVRRRREINNFYREILKDADGICFLDEPEGHFSNYWLTTILVNTSKTGGITRENIRLEFEKENIEARPLWKPMHLQPVFKEYPFLGNGVSEKLFEEGICLPSGTNMTDDDLERISNVLKRLFGLS